MVMTIYEEIYQNAFYDELDKVAATGEPMPIRSPISDSVSNMQNTMHNQRQTMVTGGPNHFHPGSQRSRVVSGSPFDYQ